HRVQIAIVVNIAKTCPVRTVVVQNNTIVRNGCKSTVGIVDVKHIVLTCSWPVRKKNIVPAIAIHVNKIGASRSGRRGGNVFKSGFLKRLRGCFFGQKKQDAKTEKKY